ncbi:MAG: hypothetical protein ACRDT2_23715 [Natronosporangium sp.]
MRTRLLVGAMALALAVGGLLVPASPASADCGHNLHRNEYSGGGIFWGNGTNIRTGPHLSCVSIGQGNPGDGIDVHCAILFTAQDQIWFYARDLQTGREGWSRRSALRIPNSELVDACQSEALIFVPPTT